MTRGRRFEVVKASGVTEPYNRGKIARTLRRAGASERVIDAILDEAEETFHPGITTRAIFRAVMNRFERHAGGRASRYDLKEAIRRLGPDGYSFETYVGEILRETGWRTAVRRTIQGRCAVHEIDITAEREEDGIAERILVECKFHQSAGTFVDLKEMLYTWARLLDINERDGVTPWDAVMMVSNTRISGEGTSFGRCRGVRMLSWRHPAGGSLEEIVTRHKLYPVTVLRASESYGAEKFSRAGMTLARDFVGGDAAALARRLGIPVPTAGALVREADELLTGNGDDGGPADPAA
jgi:hypothetical protein